MNDVAIDAVLFDLDGTLLDTAPDMAAALNALLIEEGAAPIPFAQIREHVSHGGAALVRLGFPEARDDEFERLRLRLLKLYRRDIPRETRLFDGLESVLGELERAHVPWGVVTNKPGWLTEPLLAALDLASRAGCVVSGDTLSERKPHPLPLLHAARLMGLEPLRCLYVGDAERDMRAARAAGMRTLIARYGYLSAADRPQDWLADGMVDRPQDILTWMQATAPRQQEFGS
ncbi:MAG TPA: phosphoglycolate phosphatase [Steroidobacteraceae bacterium]|nr:phosphoglycolate phosphatase [Steroidobacteraceae bacterium]